MMKIKFDSKQPYQEDAVNSIEGLFDGQPIEKGDFTIIEQHDFMGSRIQTELGLGNNLVLNEEALLKNLHTVQERYDLDHVPENEFKKNGLNFSVEMETGTGKTYVYLRTAISG